MAKVSPDEEFYYLYIALGPISVTSNGPIEHRYHEADYKEEDGEI